MSKGGIAERHILFIGGYKREQKTGYHLCYPEEYFAKLSANVYRVNRQQRKSSKMIVHHLQ